MFDLTGSARPRPIRTAFLVEDADHSDLVLDGIFADCYSRWGGRFSLIVPCIGGRISAAYWPWLEAFDPDLVYSFVPLRHEGVLEVHERLYPGRYIFHDRGRYVFPNRSGEPRLDLASFKPDYSFKPLSSLSTIFRLARYSPTPSMGAPVTIIDKWFGEHPTRFLTDNFGTYASSMGTNIFPNDARTAANLLTIVSPEAVEDPRRGVPRDLSKIPSEFEAFAAFATRRAACMSLASLVMAPKLDVGGGHWSTSFNLVVGNSFADRIMFWNARLLIPSWLDNDLYCLRIDEDQLADHEFLNVLGGLLKQRNHVNSGAGGPPLLTVRSCSLTVERLEAAKAAIEGTKPWGPVASESVPHLDALVPTADAFFRARENNRIGNELFGPASWKQFAWTPPTIKPPTVLPDHLSDAPPRQAFNLGYWSTDYFLEYDGPKSRFLLHNRWELSRRWRMAGAFNVAVVDPQPVAAFWPAPRRGRMGTFVIAQNAEHPVETVEVPSAETAISYALVADGESARPEAEHGEIQLPSKVVWTAPSNEARYLKGVLGMAGGLDNAEGYLLHPFLTKTFGKLGGTPNLPAENVTPAVNLLKKQRGRSPTFDLRSEHETTVLASLIVKAAKGLKDPKDDIGYAELHDDWVAYRAAYRRRHSQQDVADREGRLVKWEKDALDACLAAMRKRKMVFQGHLWTCRQCHHRNWVDMTSLRPTLTCEVCGATEEAPVDIRWRFRPNQFLIESLRDHSVLSLVWALSALRDRSRSSFMYAPPTSFGYARDHNSSAEADLLVISDGQVILCEVKSSWGLVQARDLEEFAVLALRLRPGQALLAVMEKGTGPVAALDRAQQKLSTAGVQFRTMVPHPDDRYHSLYLHHG